MKGFETGVAHLRSCATRIGLIAESENDDVLFKRVAKVLSDQNPFDNEEEEDAADERRTAIQRRDTPEIEEGKVSGAGSSQESE